ncbi:hypothetical protein ACG83_32485 [Frankia sp. R43]|nr:hypothetical protein ACG83_32485 [Frankia sp. R43]
MAPAGLAGSSPVSSRSVAGRAGTVTGRREHRAEGTTPDSAGYRLPVAGKDTAAAAPAPAGANFREFPER